MLVITNGSVRYNYYFLLQTVDVLSLYTIKINANVLMYNYSVSLHYVLQEWGIALNNACAGGHQETVSLLLDRGMDPNTQGKVKIK